eukprot:symbB.v1.2.033525.t2/scaffold4178.1/size44766/3
MFCSTRSFKDLAATLADAGIRPHDVWEALTTAAEACDFPTSTSTPDSAEHVAAFFYGHDTGRSSRHLQERLGGFLKDLSQVSEGQKLGRRPLQTLARLMVSASKIPYPQWPFMLAASRMEIAEAWPTTNSRQRSRLRRYLLQVRGCTIILIALSIGGFTSMMVDGTLVNTHLRAARCVNTDFQRENPADCNGMVVSFPTVVLISTILCFATLASLLWIAIHLVDTNTCRAMHDLSTMLVIFAVRKKTKVGQMLEQRLCLLQLGMVTLKLSDFWLPPVPTKTNAPKME